MERKRKRQEEIGRKGCEKGKRRINDRKIKWKRKTKKREEMEEETAPVISSSLTFYFPHPFPLVFLKKEERNMEIEK